MNVLSKSAMVASTILCCHIGLATNLAMAQEKPSNKFDRGCHSDEKAPDSSITQEYRAGKHAHNAAGEKQNVNCDVIRVKDDEALKEMQQYVETYIPRETIITSIKMPSGKVLECVDMYQQPAFRRKGMENHEIQFEPRNVEMKGELVDEKSGGSFKSIETGFEANQKPRVSYEKDTLNKDPEGSGNEGELKQIYGSETEICPEGTIPITRITLKELMRFETLDDYFNRTPPHTQNGPTSLHQYAHAYRNVDNWGAQSIFNIWDPYTERADEFSLSQIWIVRGSGDNRETVETGWQKYRDLYGDYDPNLFIYFTPDNYGSGGCYNLSCGAFVQVNNSVHIGSGFSNFSQHPAPSTAYTMTLRWQKDGNEGHWWLKYGNTWVGYYPRNLFDSNGLRNYGAKVDFGGEIIDRQISSNHTRTDMGSGYFPSSGFGYAAYQRQIRYITTSNFWGIRPSLTESRSDRDCYDIDVSSSSGSWERYFYFGGSGNNTHCR